MPLLPPTFRASTPVTAPSLTPLPATGIPRRKRRLASGEGATHDTEAPDIVTASADYATRFRGAAGQFLLDRQAEVLRRLLLAAAPAPRTVIEIGGGHAQLTPAFLEAGCRVSVQGSSPDCFQRLGPLQERWVEHLDLRVGSLWALPYDAGSADLVCAIRLLAHVERWRELLAGMARVTRHHLVVDVVVPTALQRLGERAWFLKRHLEKNTRPYFIYPMTDIVGELTALGFDVRLAVGQFVVPMVVHRHLRLPALSRALERAGERLGLHGRMGSPVLLLATRR